MNAATNHYQTNTLQSVARDIAFEPHFAKGNTGVIARHDAPKLRFSQSMPLELVRASVDQWNAAIQASFTDGHGYYAFSPMDELETPGYHVVVLFANRRFYEAFMGSVIDVDFLVPSIFDKPAQVPVVIEEISYDDVKLPWEE